MEEMEGISLESPVVGLNEKCGSVFCRSCGKSIRSDAEICPHCGVRQKSYSAPSLLKSMEENIEIPRENQVVEFAGKSKNVFCRSCGKSIRSDAEICPHCGVRQKKNVQIDSPKNPGLAAVASFLFAGLGQIYNGEFVKGFVFIAIQILNIFLMVILIGFITYLIVWAIGIYDAYKSAEKINARMANS